MKNFWLGFMLGNSGQSHGYARPLSKEEKQKVACVAKNASFKIILVPLTGLLIMIFMQVVSKLFK